MKKYFYVALLLVVGFISAFADTDMFDPKDIPVITTAQYDQMDKNNQVYILVFTMYYYCPPCRKMEKMLLPNLVANYKDVSNVHIYQVNVYGAGDTTSDPNSLASRFGAVGIPHLLVVYNDTVLFSQLGFSENMMPNLENQIKEVVNKFK